MDILGWYRPHSGTSEDFLNNLTRLFNNHSVMIKKTILLGDLIVNLLINSSDREHFMNFMQFISFVPKITKQTRSSRNISEIPSSIDPIWTNFIDISFSGILSFDLPYICPIFFLLPFDDKKNTNDEIKITFRDQNHERTTAFMKAKTVLNWSSLIAPDPSTYVENILNTLNGLCGKFIPLFSQFISKKRLSKPWIASAILNLIKQKSNAFLLYRRGLISVRQNNLKKQSY